MSQCPIVANLTGGSAPLSVIGRNVLDLVSVLEGKRTCIDVPQGVYDAEKGAPPSNPRQSFPILHSPHVTSPYTALQRMQSGIIILRAIRTG